MKILVNVTVLVILGATPALGQDAAEDDPRGLEDQIARAIMERDTAFVDRVWDRDFVYTGVRGEIRTKADILAELKSGELKFDEMRFDEIKVQTYGDTAVVTGRATTKGRGPLGPISGRFRYTRVYVKREAGWKLVAFQGTPIVQP